MIQKIAKIYAAKKEDVVFAYQYFLVLRLFVNILVSIIVTKTISDIKDIGNYEFAFFIITNFTFFWTTAIKNTMLSEKSAESNKNQNYFGNYTFICSLLGLLIGSTLFIWPQFLKATFGWEKELTWMRWIGVLVFVSAPVVLIENILLIQKKAKTLFGYSHIAFIIYLFFVSICAIFYPTIESYLIAFGFWCLVRLGYLGYLICGTLVNIQWQQSKDIISKSIPLLGIAILGQSMDLIDGWFAGLFFGTEEFAIFRYGAKELPFTNTLFAALSTAMIPIVSQDIQLVSELKKRSNRLMHLVFPIAMISMILSPILFPIIYNDNFKESAYIFNIYILIIASRVLLPQTINYAKGQNKVLIYASLFEIVLNIVLSYFLMQKYEILGLAFATCIAYSVQKIILILYNAKVNKIYFKDIIDVGFYSLYVSLLIVIFIISCYLAF